VCEWPESSSSPRLPGDALVRHFSVHALISNVAFVVGTPQDLPALRKMGFTARYVRVFNPEEQLHIVEFNRKVTAEAKLAFETRMDFKQVSWGKIGDALW